MALDRKVLSLVIAIIMGLMAVFLINRYLEENRPSATTASEGEVLVLVATRHIPRGQTIERSMVNVETMPEEWAQPGAISSPEMAIGKMAFVDISKGEQVLANKLMQSQSGQESSLAMRTPPGKRAITVPMDQLSAVGGMVRPGDYVDILGSFPVPQMVEGKTETQIVTVTLFQNVLVLAVGGQVVGRESEPSAEAGKGLNTITLALTPQESELITFAQEQGKLKLVLRPPLDTATQPLPIASWDALLQHILSQQGEQPIMLPQEEPETPAAEEPKKTSIEIYRGGTKK